MTFITKHKRIYNHVPLFSYMIADSAEPPPARRYPGGSEVILGAWAAQGPVPPRRRPTPAVLSPNAHHKHPRYSGNLPHCERAVASDTIL